MPVVPTVAIVGRPNVGKSALFNRLAKQRIAIVHDQPGVTRDRLMAECWFDGIRSTLIDTGGIGADIDASFDDQVRTEANLAMDMADVILLVTDGRTGITPVDRDLASQLRRTKKPVLVVVNKIDDQKQSEFHHEFLELGFESVLPISAAHGRGILELVDAVREHLPHIAEAEPSGIESEAIKLAIVGRPNVGKSSLINAILQDQRTLVSETAGTTRDSVDIPYERDGKQFVLIDTAGIRPRGRHSSSVEVFSVMRSEKSIERADICALVIDAVDGVTAQDKKIAGLIQENEKACLVAVNKLDLVKPQTHFREFLDGVLGQIRANLFFLDYAPIDVLSAQTRENLERLFQSIEKIERHAQRTIGTGQLNRLLQAALAAHPPPLRGNRRLKLLYATEIDYAETAGLRPPTFVLFVNDPDLLTDDYRRYLEGKIREINGYYGLPILFRVRSRH
ncbi:MAG: ribosome biogenesis GTPase Der [Verrucomicrobia bacterium]|nr:ribosome biogenesis GTPase Der [Verrucomicrobiota bacterium]